MILPKALTGFGLVLCLVTFAYAVCGDVNGDQEVRAADALRVLKKAVGQNVEMICNETLPVQNQLSFAHSVTCNNSKFTAQMEWSEHSNLDWSAYTSSSFPLANSSWKRIDDATLGGNVTIHFGNCGTVIWDIDGEDMVWPLPEQGGVIVYAVYQASNNTVYLSALAVPYSLNSSLLYAETPSPVVLASAPAPAGLGSALEE